MKIAERKSLKGRKFLNFVICGENYCIDIVHVREIMAYPEITPIPQTPDYIKGVINLRGKIIPIVDLRKKFELPPLENTERACVIVVELEYQGDPTLMGIIVDETREVANIPDEDISDVPYINAKIESEYIEGIAEMEEGIIIIMDITHVLSNEEFVLLSQMEKRKQAKAEEN